MGIERARVVEVHSPTSPTGRVGCGYLIRDRLVLTTAAVAGRSGPTSIRPAATGVWRSCALRWSDPSGEVAVLEVGEPAALMLSPDRTRWGRITGLRPVAVVATGFPPGGTRSGWPRDPEQFLGHVVPGEAGRPLVVTGNAGSRPPADGMEGAALFAGAELVAVLVAGGAGGLGAVPVSALVAHPPFVALVGDAGTLPLTDVSTPAFGLRFL